MANILTIVHIIVCFFLVIIVLLQQGKGANMGATFGGSSQTVFGSEGPMPLLNKVTTLAAVTFMVTSISLAYISSHKSTSSVMKDFDVQKTQENAIERSAEPLPQSGSAPDMPLTPAETPVPQAAPATAPEKTSAVQDEVTKPAEAVVPKAAAPQEVAQPVQEKQEKAAVPASEGKAESKEK
ncbi:MAG: preprotein translocase subunit SecG [Proteobacteria bacterium]|nr:preprotein translocase subunit SecG [Pseudomonadota bacterium]MBU4296266.1 preprotein translocase subunit SecG [Pseudomonadota bacterium]MCG2746376.1 preprotein translocase subunit SecG [Desulfobulbaceae bacterium]